MLRPFRAEMFHVKHFCSKRVAVGNEDRLRTSFWTRFLSLAGISKLYLLLLVG
jgi:hypothetical protein